jgi:hypothetical protein
MDCGMSSTRASMSARRREERQDFGIDRREKIYRITAQQAGVSELGDEICLKGVTPECFYRGSSSEPDWIPRLKHAGMTDFG